MGDVVKAFTEVKVPKKSSKTLLVSKRKVLILQEIVPYDSWIVNTDAFISDILTLKPELF